MQLNQQTLYFGLPIKYTDEATLFQPTLKEILYSNLSIEQILEPFVTLDKRNFEQESKNENITNFDMFFVQLFMGYFNYINANKSNVGIKEYLNLEDSDILVIKRLINALKFLFKTDNVELCISEGILNDLENNFIYINKSYKIDRSTYEDLKDTICQIFDTEIKINKTPKKEKSKKELELEALFEQRRREYEEKYGKGKKKDKNRDNISIYTLINYIIHSKFSQYNYTTIQDLTIFQIKNTFKYYQSQESYDIDMDYRTSGNFKMDNKSEHWFFDK